MSIGNPIERMYYNSSDLKMTSHMSSVLRESVFSSHAKCRERISLYFLTNIDRRELEDLGETAAIIWLGFGTRNWIIVQFGIIADTSHRIVLRRVIPAFRPPLPGQLVVRSVKPNEPA